MVEWYRGVAVGGPAATEAQVNDLGAGTYFADRLEAAQYYAKFRSGQANESPSAQRTSLPAVLYGDIGNETIGRVLDLTSGPEGEAWTKFAEERTFSGPTNRELMAASPKQYGSMFKGWADKRGINLNTFSAIVGPEYGAGGKVLGKQMCVRNPEIADKVTAQMIGRSAYAPKSAFLPTGIPSLTYTIRGQANASALIATAMIVDTFQRTLNDYFQEKWAQEKINADILNIRAWQENHPADGALIVTTFARTVINSEFLQNKSFLQPGDVFEFNSVFFGATPADAAKEMSKTQELVQGDVKDGPYRTIRRKQAVWIVPRIPASEEGFTTLPGRWAATIGGWKGVFGFDVNGDCYWKQGAETAHTGKWKVVGSAFQWTYTDEPSGWERVFNAAMPLKKATRGEITIKGINHGFYSMDKNN